MPNRVLIPVTLDRFEGPLDLLLYLIQTHELDISKVSISKITDQYLAYVRQMQELNFDQASEFLVLAATLLHWKSKALLPQEDKSQGQGAEGDEPALTQEQLLLQLMEHQRFLEAGEDLSQLPILWKDVFIRSNQKPPVERLWRDMNMTDLATTYQSLLVRARKRSQVLRKETVSLTDKIREFSTRLKIGQLVEFKNFLSDLASRSETVATFLAALELSRLKKMRLYQTEVYSSIYLELIQNLENFDFTLASGFDAPEAAEPARPPAPAEVTQIPAQV